MVRVRKSFTFRSKELYIPSEETAWFPSEQHSCDWNDHPDPHLPCFNKRRLAVAHVEERPAWKDKPMDTHGWSFVTFDHLFRGAIILIQSRSNPYAFEESNKLGATDRKSYFHHFSDVNTKHYTTRRSVCSLAACHLHWPLASRRCLKRSSAEKPLIPALATFFMTGPGHGRPEHWIFSCAT